jgi:hypothetical protein
VKRLRERNNPRYKCQSHRRIDRDASLAGIS